MAMGTTDSNSGSPIAEKLSETCRQEAKAVLSEIKLFAVNWQAEKLSRNIISHEEPDSLYKRLIKAIVNPFTMVLLYWSWFLFSRM